MTDEVVEGWRPIEAAPRDGSGVLLLMPNRTQLTGSWWPGDSEAPEAQWGYSILGIAEDGTAVWATEFIDIDPIGWRPVPEDWMEANAEAFAALSGLAWMGPDLVALLHAARVAERGLPRRRQCSL